MDNLKEFHNDFLQQISISADSNEDFLENQFFEKAIEYLSEDGVIEDYTYLPYRKKALGLKVDGYDFIEDREILNLFIVDFDNSEFKTLTKTDVNSSFKRVEKFTQYSIEKKYYENLEETSEGYELAYFLYHNKSRFSTIKIILLSNKHLSTRVKNFETKNILQYSITYDIWDINRFFQIESSKQQKESLEIDFIDEFNYTIPSLFAHLPSSNYKSYLCVISGDILTKLYEKYGAKLLEANVRSFLQFRGNINKGIRKTINDTPEMFFAYNNGLTATANYIELDEQSNIKKLKNFQIVNGGQTTASLFNTKKKEKIDLSNIFVQMKLTIIDEDKTNEIVPNISKFANTQNRVSEADFFSNHAFHIRVEKKSRRIWAPVKLGEMKQTKWFYERARGQYLEIQSQMSDAQKREFKQTYLKPQMFSKTDLAKYLLAWEVIPQIVSRGAQKNFKEFAERITKEWETNNEQFNDLYYKFLIAKAIVFKSCEKIIFKESWYGGYRANIVAYTISSIAYLANKKRQSVNFIEIWQNQNIDTIFENEIKSVGRLINEFITDTPENLTNVTEYCKREFCWEKLKSKIDSENFIYLSNEFLDTLIDTNELNDEIKYSKKKQRVDNQIISLTELFKIAMENWQFAIEWGEKNRLLSSNEIKLLQLIPNGKYPSNKQQKTVVAIIEKLEDEGMKSIW